MLGRSCVVWSVFVCLGSVLPNSSLPAGLGTWLNSALSRNSLKVLGQICCKQREVAPRLLSDEGGSTFLGAQFPRQASAALTFC